MKHFPYIAIFVLVLATLACGVPSASPEATVTPLSTDTLMPTDTLVPTDTSTPSPTATLNAHATAAVKGTKAAGDALDQLDALLGDTDIPYKSGHLLWQQTRSLDIQLSGPDNKILNIDKDLTAENFIFKSDVKWEASGILLCGAIFRSEPNLEKGKQYQFIYLRLSGLPAWAVEVHEFGRFKNSPTQTKFSDALDLSNGSTNTFVLVVQDDNFTIYINNVRQGKYYDYSKQRSEGTFGVFASQDSGKGNCEYKNSWVWALE